MLTDAELQQMLADAESLKSCRCIQCMSGETWVRDIDRPRCDCIVCDKFIVMAVNSHISDAVVRLVDEVKRLRQRLQPHTSHPSRWPGYHSDKQLAATWGGIHREALDIIDACHIHGVEVPEHLKAYEEGGDA